MFGFKRQFSSGGIVFRSGKKGPEIALIARDQGKVWCLPKGVVEKGESPPKTALREVKEETGLTGRILRKIGEMTYWFVSKEERSRIFKTVYFFLIRKTGGSISDHDSEVEEVAWFPIEEALRKLTYPNERRLLVKAKRWLTRGEENP